MNSSIRRMQTLRATEVHADVAIRVIAIEAVHYNAEKSGQFYRLFAHIEPIAMVVCEAGDNRVVNLASSEIPFEELKRDVPGLRALLGET